MVGIVYCRCCVAVVAFGEGKRRCIITYRVTYRHTYRTLFSAPEVQSCRRTCEFLPWKLPPENQTRLNVLFFDSESEKCIDARTMHASMHFGHNPDI